MRNIALCVRTLLLAAVTVIGARSAWAQGPWDCGKAPGTVTATLTDGTLTISGSGAMGDYDQDNPAPWFDVKNSISRAVFQNGVTSIGSYAFHLHSFLESVSIPNSVTSIGERAFNGSGLKSVAIPNSVTSIGMGAFGACWSLDSVTIPSSVTSIEEGTFVFCSGLTSVVIPNSVTVIGERAFARCDNLQLITIPNSVTSIGKGAFDECSELKSVVVPNSVASIGSGAFPANCTIEIAPDHPYFTYDNDVLFNKAKTVLVRYPASKQGAYTIPSGVTSIGDNAFYDCTGLLTITIPESVTFIGSEAFRNCRPFYAIFILSPSPPVLGEYVFDYTQGMNFCVHVPDSGIEAYREAETWGDFTCIRSLDYPEIGLGTWDCGKIPETVYATLGYDSTLTIKGTGAMTDFNYRSYPGYIVYVDQPWNGYKNIITNVVIGDEVTSLGNYAFYGSPVTSVICLSAIPPTPINANVFLGVNIAAASLYVPDSSIDLYSEDEFWGGFGSIKSIDEYVSVAASDRVIPAAADPVNKIAVIAPQSNLIAEFAAGPNPAGKSSGAAVSFYYRGNRIKGGALTVYDASGRAVNKITVRDAAAIVGDNGGRAVGSWNLTDAKGRPAPTGTYLVRGTITASNGRSERVSAVVGVR